MWTRYAKIAIFLIVATSNGAVAQSYNDIKDNVFWCIDPRTANSTFVQQAAPVNRELCKAVVAGSVYFGVGLSYVNRTQADLVRNEGMPRVCSLSLIDQQIAVATIAACQCHNRNIAAMIMANQRAALRAMREWGTGVPDQCPGPVQVPNLLQ